MNLAPSFNIPTHPTRRKPSPRTAHKIAAIQGEMDIATTPVLREGLNDAVDSAAEGHRRLIIDLSGVSFCDASGLALLIGVQRRAQRLTTSVSLAAPRPQVMKLLRITGLDRSLTIHTTLTAAIDARLSDAFA